LVQHAESQDFESLEYLLSERSFLGALFSKGSGLLRGVQPFGNEWIFQLGYFLWLVDLFGAFGTFVGFSKTFKFSSPGLNDEVFRKINLIF